MAVDTYGLWSKFALSAALSEVQCAIASKSFFSLSLKPAAFLLWGPFTVSWTTPFHLPPPLHSLSVAAAIHKISDRMTEIDGNWKWFPFQSGAAGEPTTGLERGLYRAALKGSFQVP